MLWRKGRHVDDDDGSIRYSFWMVYSGGFLGLIPFGVDIVSCPDLGR